jgi:glycosyltransferase involved in cell wall biosynthesis
MARLRILMIIQKFYPDFSGQGIQMQETAKKLVKRGVEVTFVSAGREKYLKEEQKDGYLIRRIVPGVPLIETSPGKRRRLWNLSFAVKLFFYLIKNRRSFDLIHLHTKTDALYAAALFSRLFRKKMIMEMTLMGADDAITIRTKDHFRWLKFFLFSHLDGYVAISKALYEAYIAAGLSEKKIRIITQGVDTDRFRPAEDKKGLRKKLGLPLDGIIISFVGSFIERKGGDILTSAFARLKPKMNNVHLVIVGRYRFDEEKEPERADFSKQILAEIERLCLKDNIIFVGAKDNVEEYLTASDIFLFPSRKEGFGTAIIEAMACLLPPVISAMPGISEEIVTDGEDGIIVTGENPEGFAEAVIGLALDEKLRRNMGGKARDKAASRFSLDMIAERYIKFYQEILKE